VRCNTLFSRQIYASGPLGPPAICSRQDVWCMTHILLLLINPNGSAACSAGIFTAVASFCLLLLTDDPVLDMVTLRQGLPAIYAWHVI
jgi:hypothetical protein